jgi:hypothetical protein
MPRRSTLFSPGQYYHIYTHHGHKLRFFQELERAICDRGYYIIVATTVRQSFLSQKIIYIFCAD